MLNTFNNFFLYKTQKQPIMSLSSQFQLYFNFFSLALNACVERRNTTKLIGLSHVITPYPLSSVYVTFERPINVFASTFRTLSIHTSKLKWRTQDN